MMKIAFEYSLMWVNFLFSAAEFALFVVNSDAGEWGEAGWFIVACTLNAYVFLSMRKRIREAMP